MGGDRGTAWVMLRWLDGLPTFWSLFGNPDPALGFHLEAGQGTGGEQHYRDAQVQGGFY